MFYSFYSNFPILLIRKGNILFQNRINDSMIFNDVAYATLTPRGNRPIDRMTNVPGSCWLLPGLINQAIFPVSTFTETSCFPFATLKSILAKPL